jgi:hypothetical protein
MFQRKLLRLSAEQENFIIYTGIQDGTSLRIVDTFQRNYMRHFPEERNLYTHFGRRLNHF